MRPLPVNCWDWTKAIALPRVPMARRNAAAGAYWGLGRDALGLSHLTYETTGTVILHRLDQPPFPCKPKLMPRPARQERRPESRSGAKAHRDFPACRTNRFLVKICCHTKPEISA